MSVDEALKNNLGTEPSLYNEALRRRFLLWKDQSGNSIQSIAKMMNRSMRTISQYIKKELQGELRYIEKDIKNLLKREEDLQFVTVPKVFCDTEPSKLLWEALQYCDQKGKMGVGLAPSGTGKTETCKEYKRRNRNTVFITADITSRRPGAVLGLLSRCLGGHGYARRSIPDNLQKIIERLKNSKRLIIIDDAHFLTWESFEAIRKIYDYAGVGVVYIGQERLYDQMRGADNKAYLFDQIFSRIAIKRDRFIILKKDARKIINCICPGIDEDCIDFLYKKAKGKGRFRTMINLLEVATDIQDTFHRKVDVDLLIEAERFLFCS